MVEIALVEVCDDPTTPIPLLMSFTYTSHGGCIIREHLEVTAVRVLRLKPGVNRLKRKGPPCFKPQSPHQTVMMPHILRSVSDGKDTL